MLRGIHKASRGWLGKGVMAVIMGLLVISFAIWGIGDIFRGFGSRTFATIGNTEIGVEQFRNYYNDKINQLSRAARRPITPDQARALGLDRQVLGELVAETTLDEKARQMKLGISDADIPGRITSDPNFQGVNGQFDRGRFQDLIRQAGYSEQRFVLEQRQLALRRQIALSLTGDIKPPLAAQNAANMFRNERRSADIVALGAAQAGDIPAPTPEVLTKYFDERKALFRAPETRKLVLLSLTPADQARWSAVSDEDAKAFYEQRKAEYGTPERRHLRQIVFPNAEDARAAAEKLAKGESFDDLVKERGLNESDVDLGVVTKTSVIDPAVADAAFALKDGETSAPVAGRFGTVIVQAKEIQPARQRPYEEVAPAIKNTLGLQRARAEIGELRDKVEDDRAAGATLAETANKLKLVSRTIEAIDRSGRDAGGAPVPNLPQGVDVLTPAFNTDVGVDTEALQIPGGGFIWYDVVAINRSRERTLDEVRPQVETRWRNDEIAARLKAKADDMLAKLKGGATLAQVASENNLTVQSVTELQRNQAKSPLSATAVADVFRTAKGAAETVEGDQPATRLVFAVTDVVDPKLDAQSSEAKQLSETLGRGYSEDMIAEYVAKLESELGVRINQSALQQIVGGGRGDN